MGSDLTGNYFVQPTAPALAQVQRICKGKAREYWKLRNHAFKLVWWPDNADLDWDWIKGFERLRIGELRIDEAINQQVNLRIIFFKANEKRPSDELPVIWLLHVYAKKSQGFGRKELETFKARRQLIVLREYGGSTNA